MKKFIVILSFMVAAVAIAAAAGFGGVGIDGTPLENGEIVVRQLVSGGPAQLAGIQVGDVIIAIDGTPTKGSNFKEIVTKRLRGEAGTHVILTIRRAPRANPLRFTLSRRAFVAPGT